MSTDQLVRQALADLTADLRPQPEAARRARVGLRRSRRVRRTAVASIVVIALAGAWFVGWPPGMIEPQPPASWTERLMSAPARGQVATADPGYVRALSRIMSTASLVPDQRIDDLRVLFVDDIGQWRVAVAAFRVAGIVPTDGPTDGPTAGPRDARAADTYFYAQFLAPRGADATTLAASSQMSGPIRDPFLTTVLTPQLDSTQPSIVVALAPPGCTVSAAALPDLADWRDEPTGSYAVRQDVVAEWWRVTCDGIVRAERPADLPRVGARLDDAAVAAMSAEARGACDHLVALEALQQLAMRSHELSDTPRTLWCGRIAWPDGNDGSIHTGQTAVAVGRLLKGVGWVGAAAVRYDERDAGGSEGAQASFVTSADPTSNNAVVALRLDPDSQRVLVIGPGAGRAVRAVRDGKVLATGVLSGGVGVVDVDDPAAPAYEIVAASGTVLGRTVLETKLPDLEVSAWGAP